MRVIGRTQLEVRAEAGTLGVRLVGRLLDDEGGPVARADIALQAGRLLPRITPTDEEGRFDALITDSDLELAGGDTLQVTARYAGSVLWSPAEAEARLARQPLPVQLQVVLLPEDFDWAARARVQPRALVTARSTEGPLSNARLELSLGAQHLTTRTDDAGHAVFRGLTLPAPGAHTVRIRHVATFRHAEAVHERVLVARRAAKLEVSASPRPDGTLEFSGTVTLRPEAEPLGTAVVRFNGRPAATLELGGGGQLKGRAPLAEFGALHGSSVLDVEVVYEGALGEGVAAMELGRFTVPEAPVSTLDWVALPAAGLAAAWLWLRRRKSSASPPARGAAAAAPPRKRPSAREAPRDGLGGHVFDGLTGRPLPGAQVQLVLAAAAPAASASSPGEDARAHVQDARTVTTDADGWYELRGFPEGRGEAPAFEEAVAIRFTHEAFHPHQIPLSRGARGALPVVALVPLRADALRAYEGVLRRFGLAGRFGRETPRELEPRLSRASRVDSRAATVAFERAYFGPPAASSAAGNEAREALEGLERGSPP